MFPFVFAPAHPILLTGYDRLRHIQEPNADRDEHPGPDDHCESDFGAWLHAGLGGEWTPGTQ